MNLPVEFSIKKEIENVFGRRIVSSRDCIQLSDEIYQRTQTQINPNTLRRFFGLVKAETSPSNSTLTILSQYCGFQSLDEVKRINKEDISPDSNAENFLHFLVSLFRNVQVKDEEDETFLNIALNTIYFLNRNPCLTEKFQIQVSKTKNGRIFYFEKFVNIDRLNSYYGNGLRHYYSENPDTKAQVFAHSLLVYRFWLTEERKILEKHFDIITGQNVKAPLPPFVYGRYLAALLYYADNNSQNTEKILLHIYDYYTSFPKSYASPCFPRFELYIIESLILTGHYEEGLYYIREVKKSYSEEAEIDQWKFCQNFLLFEAIALCKLNNQASAVAIFDKINPIQFYFLRKSFCNILYLILSEQLKKKQSPRQEEQLNQLIRETGFYRLKKLFE